MYDVKNLIKEDKMMMVKNFLGKRMFTLANVVALMLVVQTANSACIWLAHQPEFPKEANIFKRKNI